VLEALRDAVGEAGTLVMPTQSWQLCDPAFLDITPAAWWPTIRDHLPVYSAERPPERTRRGRWLARRGAPWSRRHHTSQSLVLQGSPMTPNASALGRRIPAWSTESSAP
jgi:aminoglycoside 3-N-acetyltransferase